jgi:dTDP-4-dehydrorhamnose 3,5-epimerase
MKSIELLAGEVFKDARGQISSLNNFHFDGVKRMYILHHPNTETRRGWNGHQFERKWFYCIKGAFDISVVTIDNWDAPSPTLRPEIHHLSGDQSALLCVPAGRASLIQATTPDSILMVLSDKTLAESAADSYKFDMNLWTTPEATP